MAAAEEKIKLLEERNAFLEKDSEWVRKLMKDISEQHPGFSMF